MKTESYVICEGNKFFVGFEYPEPFLEDVSRACTFDQIIEAEEFIKEFLNDSSYSFCVCKLTVEHIVSVIDNEERAASILGKLTESEIKVLESAGILKRPIEEDPFVFHGLKSDTVDGCKIIQYSGYNLNYTGFKAHMLSGATNYLGDMLLQHHFRYVSTVPGEHVEIFRREFNKVRTEVGHGIVRLKQDGKTTYKPVKMGQNDKAYVRILCALVDDFITSTGIFGNE